MNEEKEIQVVAPEAEESSEASVIENENSEFKCGNASSDEEKKKYKTEDKNDEKEDKNSEDNSEDEKSSDESEEEVSDEEEKEEKKKKYNLEEVTEYAELNTRFAELESNYNNLLNDKAALEAEVNDLRAFKLSIERTQKQDMIKSFYMLSDEDKKDVVDNIDNYSLDDIEAKLSILCVRNRVNFSALEEENANDTTTFNINSTESDESIPAWIKLALETENSLH